MKKIHIDLTLFEVICMLERVRGRAELRADDMMMKKIQWKIGRNDKKVRDAMEWFLGLVTSLMKYLTRLWHFWN